MKTTPPTPIATNPALEAAIDACPENEANWLVYADYLQAQGDPRGELIAFQAKGKAKAASELIAANELYFLGDDIPKWEEDGIVQYDWRLGFFSTMQVMVLRDHEDEGIAQAPIVQALLRLPSSRFAQALTLGCPSIHENDVEKAVIAALVDAGHRPTLRRLEFETDLEEEMLSWTITGDLGPLWRLYPNLKALRIHAGSLDLGTEMNLPELEELTIETCGLTRENVQSISSATWPKLNELDLSFGSISRGATAGASDIVSLLASVRESLPALRRLGLANCELADELCDVLAKSPDVFSRLEAIDLSRGTMTDAGADVLAAALRKTPQSRTLQHIDVSESYLSADGVAALTEAAAKVNVVVHADEQRDEDYDPGYRYCVTPE